MHRSKLPDDSTRLKPRPLTQLGTRRLTRAHLALSKRGSFREDAVRFGASVATGIGAELGAALQLETTLAETRITPQAELSELAVFALFDLSGSGCSAVLELETPFTVALLERLVTRERSHAAPALGLSRIEEATLGFLLLSGLGAARGGAVDGLFRPRLRRITTDRATALGPLPSRQPHVAVELRFSLEALRGAGRLYLPATAARVAAETRGADPIGPVAPELAAADLEFTCFAPTVCLSAIDAARLHPGDAVVIDSVSIVDGLLRGPARLRRSDFELRGILDPSGLTLQRASAFPQESTMQLPTEKTELTSPLPIEIEVELTRLRLTIAELGALKTGALLPLQITASEPVTLRIGGRAVARAELVDIEGEVAARILSLHS